MHTLAQLEQGQRGLPEQSGWRGKADWHCQVTREEQEGCHPSRFSQQYPESGKVSSAPRRPVCTIMARTDVPGPKVTVSAMVPAPMGLYCLPCDPVKPWR